MPTLSHDPLNLNAADQALLHDAARERAHALRQAAIDGLLDGAVAALTQSARRLTQRIAYPMLPVRTHGLEG